MTPQPQVPGQAPPQGAPPPEPPPGQNDTAALRAELERRGREVDDLKRRIMAPPPPSTPPPAPAGAPLDDAQLRTEFFKNPIGVSAAIAQRAAHKAQQRAQAGNAASYDTLVSVARDQARASDPALFDALSLEVDTMVTTQVDPQFRTNSTVWRNAFAQVKGQNIDKVMQIKGQQPPPEPPRGPAVHISREGGPSGSSPPRAPAPPSETLTDDEKHVARKLGLSEKAYLQGKKDLAGQAISGPSSWDRFITTSSRDKRREERERRNTARAAAAGAPNTGR